MRNKLWFNQVGTNINTSFNPVIDNTSLWSLPGGGSINPYFSDDDQADVLDTEPNETYEEDMPSLPMGDTIDKFDPMGTMNYSHPFDESGTPEEVNITIETGHCNFMSSELDTLYSDLNFARSQEDVDKIYKKIETLEEMISNQKCN